MAWLATSSILEVGGSLANSPGGWGTLFAAETPAAKTEVAELN